MCSNRVFASHDLADAPTLSCYCCCCCCCCAWVRRQLFNVVCTCCSCCCLVLGVSTAARFKFSILLLLLLLLLPLDSLDASAAAHLHLFLFTRDQVDSWLDFATSFSSEHVSSVDQHLKGRSFLAGESFSVADVAVYFACASAVAAADAASAKKSLDFSRW